MRINEPVTDHEVVLGDDQTLVSRTNLKGVITYADPDFIAISGFTEKELIGKNHNMVRHPDMPPEAFQDLWDTVKQGAPWTGIVKNRCKNGDYYWVEANVTPVYERGRVAGYLSVRRKASRQQIEDATRLYAEIREGTRSFRPKTGKLAISGCNSVSLRTQLIVQLSGIAVMTVATVAAGVAGMSTLMLVTGAITLGCAGGMTVWFSRRIAAPLADVRKAMRDLAEGDYFSPIDLSCSNEIGQVMRDLKSVQIKLGSDLDAAKNRAKQATRVRQALDNVSTPVMVGDANHDIIYMNQAAEHLFTDAESDIQQDLPDFDASTVLGSNIDIFHKNPEHQRHMLDAMKSRHTSAVQVGGRTLQIVANPVFDASDQRIGTAVEWTDKTAELAIEDDVQRVVDAALAGDLSRRIPLDDKTGFLEKLSKGINELVGISERIFSDVNRVLSAMSHGDLTETIDYNYSGLFGKLRQDANATVEKLTEIVGQIQESAVMVKTGTDEIAQGNADLSRRTEEQAASLEETASSMEQINATVRQNADNAAQANQLAKTAREEASKGGEVVQRAVDAMAAINTSSTRIADIVGVIDEIAFQTNLLALNASVEAARAGEQGRGFAVVASEVRNLAGRSATAAKEIKELIKDSVEKVNQGSELVNKSGESLEQIVNGVRKVTDIVGEIAAASQEQAAGISEVNKAVAQMDSLTQQNASLVEEAAAASESLGVEANSLSELTLFFDTGNELAIDTSESEEIPSGIERRSADRPWSGQSRKPSSGGANSLDFAAARTKHLSWKTRLRSFLDGGESMTEDQAVSHRDCDLGKWLYSEGMKNYGDFDEMTELERIHAEMHSVIRDVVGQKHAGQEELAEKNFSKIGPLSETIIGLLNRLEELARKNPPAAKKASAPRKSTQVAPTKAPPARASAPANHGSAAAEASDEWDEF